MATKQEALAELDAGHARFRASIAGLPDDAYDETWLGSWNLSQLLAHMAGWYRELAPGFERVSRGERPVPPGVDLSDVDAWNARFSANTKPGRAALADWDAAFAAYRAAAESLSESLYGTDATKGTPLIGNRLLQGAGIGHFAEHQPELDNWLASRTS